MAGDKTYITDNQGKLHRATRVHAVTPTDIVWSSNPNDYTVQVKIDGKWHRAVLTMDAGSSTFFDNINIDKALITGADGKQHTALIVKPESTVTLSDIKTDTHGTIAGTTTGETAVSTYSENWSDVKWQDNVNVYKVLVTGSDGKVHTALLTTSVGGGVQAIVMGVAPLSLPDAIADSLSYVKAFGGTEQRNLPDNYIQRDYIYMLDGSYLLTDIVPTYDGHYELDFQTTSIAASAYAILGGRTSGLPAGLQFARINTGWCVDGFGSRYEPSIAPIANTHYKFTFDNQVAKLESEGSTVFNTTFTTSDATGAALCINGINTNGTVSASPSGIYLYSFKAWDNQGNLVANYIPVVQQYPTAAGFYDTVSGTFKAATAGTFTAGPETVPTPDAPMDIVSNNGVLKFGVLSTNLLDLANCTDGYYYTPAGEYTATPNARLSNYIPVKAGVTYTVGLTGIEEQANVRTNLFDTAKNWLSQTVFVSYAGEKCTQSITPTQDGFLAFSANFQSSSRVDWNTAQVVQGSYTAETMPEYEPYRTGIYTDGTVETINVHTKNLFSGIVEQGGLGDGTGVETPSPVRIRTTAVPVKPNTMYNLSWTTNSEMKVVIRNVHFYDANNTWISRINATTFTTPPDTAFVRFVLQHSNATADITPSDISNVQLELGSTATDYVPYFDGGTATCEDLLSVGTYTDEQEVISGGVTRNVGVKVLDGTEDWSRSDVRTKLVLADSTTGSADWEPYCTHYQGFLGSASIGNMPDNSCKINVNTNELLIKDATHNTDLATWRQFLADQYAAGTPVIVVYPLKTATTETVAGQTLQVTSGDNALEITQASLSGLELEAKYTKVA